jgi:hypothetical protein
MVTNTSKNFNKKIWRTVAGTTNSVELFSMDFILTQKSLSEPAQMSRYKIFYDVCGSRGPASRPAQNHLLRGTASQKNEVLF